MPWGGVHSPITSGYFGEHKRNRHNRYRCLLCSSGASEVSLVNGAQISLDTQQNKVCFGMGLTGSVY